MRAENWVSDIPKDKSGWVSEGIPNIEGGKWIVEFIGEVETKNPEGKKALAKIKREHIIKETENKTDTLVKFKGVIEIKKPKYSEPDISIIINKLKEKIPDEAELISFEILSSKGRIHASAFGFGEGSGYIREASSKCEGFSEKQIKALKRCIKENLKRKEDEDA